MHLPDGGTRPAYTVQFSTTPVGGVIAGVAVTSSGADGGQLVPMLDQLTDRYGAAPQEALVDGGFTTLDDRAQAAERGTTVYGPIKEEAAKKTRGDDP